MIRYYLFIHTFLIALKISVMEPKTTHGNPILQGISSCSCTDQPIPVISREQCWRHKSRLGTYLGFKHVLFLSDCRRVEQVNNSQITSSWQEESLVTDWSHLLAADFVYHSVFVPRFVTSSVFSLAKLATKMPINCCSVL